MATFDVEAFVGRFAGRAAAVKERGIPPLEGEARRAFMASAQQDYTDYSLLAEAAWEIDGEWLVLKIPLATAE